MKEETTIKRQELEFLFGLVNLLTASNNIQHELIKAMQGFNGLKAKLSKELMSEENVQQEKANASV